MLTKRIIPCLDVKDGRVVKGVSFEHLRDAGDPVELAALYDSEGADELVLLDISATQEGRETMVDVVRKVAESISIPFTVGGGIASVDDMRRLIRAGADKVSISTAAVEDPSLIEAGAREFGNPSIIVALDAKYEPTQQDWFIYTRGGKKPTDLRAREWAEQAATRGAGELLVTSMNRDGHKNGFDLELMRELASAVEIPLIASGGAGTAQHFVDVLTVGHADAALAASIFHYKEVTISDVKRKLQQEGVPVRW